MAPQGAALFKLRTLGCCVALVLLARLATAQGAFEYARHELKIPMWDGWLVRELPRNNGKVGVLGVSYRGWLAPANTVTPFTVDLTASSTASGEAGYVRQTFGVNWARS